MSSMDFIKLNLFRFVIFFHWHLLLSIRWYIQFFLEWQIPSVPNNMWARPDHIMYVGFFPLITLNIDYHSFASPAYRTRTRGREGGHVWACVCVRECMHFFLCQCHTDIGLFLIVLFSVSINHWYVCHMDINTVSNALPIEKRRTIKNGKSTCARARASSCAAAKPGSRSLIERWKRC